MAAVGRVELASDLDEYLAGITDEYFDTRLGPKIRDDAKRYCPKRTGDLADSIEKHLDGHTLIVSATGSEERSYAAWVELGHRIYHPSTGTAGPDVVPPEPFLRPALYGVPPPPRESAATNQQKYAEAHAYAATLGEAGLAEERIGANMAAAILHETNSKRMALRVAEQTAAEYARDFGADSALARRAASAAAYIRRVTGGAA